VGIIRARPDPLPSLIEPKLK